MRRSLCRLLLEDLKTAHAATLTIYTADDTNTEDLNEAVTRAFTEHRRIDVAAGPQPLATAALPHLVAQSGRRIIQPPDAAGTETTVTIVVTARRPAEPGTWSRATIATARSHGNHTSLSEEQLRRLQPGMWGQPPTGARPVSEARLAAGPVVRPAVPAPRPPLTNRSD